MTTEEAKRFLQRRIDLIDSDYPSQTEYRDALEMAVKALEQEPSREFEDYENEIEGLQNRLDIAEYDKERLREEVTSLEEKINALEQEPKTEWIPCSDRLPEEREWYLAIFKEKDTGYQLIPRVADYIGNGKNKWQVIDEEGLCQEYRDILECIAWMPLPEPYKEG